MITVPSQSAYAKPTKMAGCFIRYYTARWSQELCPCHCATRGRTRRGTLPPARPNCRLLQSAFHRWPPGSPASGKTSDRGWVWRRASRAGGLMSLVDPGLTPHPTGKEEMPISFISFISFISPMFFSLLDRYSYGNYWQQIICITSQTC